MFDPKLENTYKDVKELNPRIAAEIAYVLAIINKREGNIRKAREYGRESIKLFEMLNLQNLEDAATRYTNLNGVALPSYIHEGVVRDRLSDLGL